MEPQPLTQELVEEVLLESIVQCVHDGDFRIAADRVRGSLKILDLGLDSLGGISLATAFRTKFTGKTGQTIDENKADDVGDALFAARDEKGGTVSRAAAKIFKLLNPEAE